MRSRRIVSGAVRSIGARICAAASAIVLLLLCFVSFDQRFEAIEAHVPESLPLPQPFFGFGQRSGVERANLLAPRLAPSDEPRPFEDLHVLGRACNAHAERLGEP